MMDGEKAVVCWLFQRGRCVYGAQCKFAHVEKIPVEKEKGGGKTHHHRGQAGVFRRWLLATFGNFPETDIYSEASLQEQHKKAAHWDPHGVFSGVVLDIAGGKGELSFQLLNLNRVNSVVIDPRPLSLKHAMNWLSKGWHKRNIEHRRFNTSVPNPACPETPTHIRTFFVPELWETIERTNPHTLEHSTLKRDSSRAAESHSEEMDLSALRKGLEVALELDSAGQHGALPKDTLHRIRDPIPSSITSSPPPALISTPPRLDHSSIEHFNHSGSSESPVLPAPQMNPHSAQLDTTSSWFGHTLSEHHTRIHHALSTATLIVGLHPDEATEYILDFALSHNIPFAVVPCCVHATAFPDRKLRDGTRVRSYDEFVRYLCEKGGEGTMRGELDCPGQNTVVYRLPSIA